MNVKPQSQPCVTTMADVLRTSKNGVSVEISVENGKCLVKTFGKSTPKIQKAVSQLQYSTMPADWVMRQILQTI